MSMREAGNHKMLCLLPAPFWTDDENTHFFRLKKSNLARLCFSELCVHISVHAARAPDVYVFDVPGEKRQGGLRVPGQRHGSRALLRVSPGQPAGGLHLPQRHHLRVHRGPEEEQRQPRGPQSVPPDLGPAGRREALHLHLQGLPGQRLEGEQHGCSSQ